VVAVVDRTKKKSTTTGLIQRAVEQCLKLCDERSFKSIAFPALATGAGQFSAEASAMAKWCSFWMSAAQHSSDVCSRSGMSRAAD
jgi:O-acetyl-ADP-ribose deacetylase (regulator of RNase III)